MKALARAVVGLCMLVLAACTVQPTNTLDPDVVERVFRSTVRVSVDKFGYGSGFVLDKHRVVTAAHVAHIENGMSDRSVVFYDGRRADTLYTIRKGKDSTVTDWGILRVDVPEEYVPLPISCEPLRLGQAVFAIGYPSELGHYVTFGHIAAINTKSKDYQSWAGVVALDMYTAPGISGGPVLNTRGEVIGIISGVARFNYYDGGGKGLMVPARQFLCGDS